MKPRTGGGAVTTSSVSPASGSMSRCSRPGLDKRHGDIGERRIGDVADHHQRLRRRLHRIGKGERPARAALIVAAQRRHLRAVEADADRLSLVERHPADIARCSAPPLLRIGSISIGFMESNTSHTVSARRNSAAGVAAAKANVRRRPSLSRLALTDRSRFAGRRGRRRLNRRRRLSDRRRLNDWRRLDCRRRLDLRRRFGCSGRHFCRGFGRGSRRLLGRLTSTAARAAAIPARARSSAPPRA